MDKCLEYINSHGSQRRPALASFSLILNKCEHTHGNIDVHNKSVKVTENVQDCNIMHQFVR